MKSLFSSRRQRQHVLLTTVCAALVCRTWPSVAAEPELPPNEKSRMAALVALKDKKYELAIEKATECIKRFRRAAERMQKRLADDKVPLELPLGTLSEDEKQKLFARGPLNDVGACYYVMGEANRLIAADAKAELTRKERLEVAKMNYVKGANLTYAVIYDPNPEREPFFWSPAEASRDALSEYFGEEID